MDRRTVLAGAAATALLAASRRSLAQQGGLPRIALVDRGELQSNMVEGGHPYWGSLLSGLRALGYVEGETIAVERWSGRDRTNGEFAEFARLAVDTLPHVIVVRGITSIGIFAAASQTIPIVGLGTFPTGSFETLSRPGGNLTGISVAAGGQVYTKLVQLLADSVPDLSRIAWVGQRDNWEGQLGDAARLGARRLDVSLELVPVVGPLTGAAVRHAFAALSREDFDAVYVSPHTELFAHRAVVAEEVAKVGLPAVALQRQYAQAGLLISYSANLQNIYRHAASYVDRLLNGASPSDMPIEYPTVFDYVINLKTARELGLTIPPEIMIQATEFIE